MTDKNRGLLLAFVGIMILSFDSLLVRLANTDPWTVLFWRGLFQGLSLFIFQLIFNRKQLIDGFLHPTPLLVCVAIIFAASTICFVESLHYTQVASTLVIVNTAPLLTAVLGFLLLKETLRFPTILAIAVSTCGIWIIFAFEPSGGQWIGNLLAMVTAISTAIYLVIMRKTKGAQAENFLILAGFFLAGFSYFQGGESMMISNTQFVYLFVLGAFVVPGAYLCISKSPAYIPAAQTSLILLTEILLGPLYVYLFIGNEPTLNDLIGGGIILVTLGIYTYWDLKQPA